MAGALDIYRVPLVGLNLIEASAGTGKTWSLCGLYLRLLLEKELDVRRILVVTFTNAATAELRARIRARISDALDILRARESAQREAPPDADLATYLDTIAATAGSTSLMRRLVLARESFDEAAIFTIHGFCQRALADTPFSGGLPFAFEALEDDEEYRLREAQDFWRRRIAQLDGACMAHLLDGGDTPASYAAYLGKCLAKPLAKVEWPPLPETPVEPDFATLAASFATLRAAWSAGEREPQAVLDAALGILNGQSYKPASIADGAREWRAWFATEDPLHRKHDARQAKFPLYRISKLKKGTRKGKEAEQPTHPFFDAAETFLTLQASYLQALHEKRLQLLQEFLASAGQALGARKRQERVVAFNDMLANLHDALGAGGNPGLAAALRERFPVALIDEFQDTDPLQFEIFRLIHGEENHLREFPVFLVGDPKQAIYSFRNADLHTYLMAASQVSARHVLGVNRRSTPALVESCNGLFGRNQEAFLQPGIAFMPAAADPRRHDPLHDESSAPRACFEVWWLPKDAQGDWLSLGAARTLCAERTAAEIARLLAEHARLQLDGHSLRASDIAVLVRTHAEGRLVRQALASRHISCVEMSPASVLRTLEAEELERVLMAIAHRGEGLLRGAVASNFMGGSAESILALSADSQAFLALIQRFATYREIWQTQGFAVMFRRFLREESVQAHTLVQPDGERRLTNLLHLGELLGEAALLHPAPDALLRWFRCQRSQLGTPPEAAQMRLESDDKLVRIVTIHKSKGLEYPVVFCPFLWMGGRGGRMELPLLREYHAEGRAVLDFGTPAAESDEVKAQRTRDADAEFMRLIYVALTRASRRCYLMAGLCREGNGTVPAGSLRSHLNWLVAGAGMTPAQWFSKDENSCTPADVRRAWLALAGRCPIEVSELPDITVPRVDDTAPAAMLAPRRGEPPRVREAWTRGSFTALTRHLHAKDKVADHDVQILPLPGVSELSASLAPDDILRFPRGANAGSCLHRVFELIDFTRDDEWDAVIERGLREFPQGAFGAESPLHAAMLRRMLGDVLACPLQENLRLDGIARTDRLNELAFTLSAPALAVDELNALLLDTGYLRERLPAHGLRGFLSGAIDLVFRHHGRIYLLDWKSNFLGESIEDYARAGMEQEMHRHAYHLQHLLYTVALRRYLGVRQPGYDHARDFGGVFYLFVRGVRPQWRLGDGSQAGVFFERAPDELVAAIDRCLDEASLRSA